MMPPTETHPKGWPKDTWYDPNKYPEHCYITDLQGNRLFKEFKFYHIGGCLHVVSQTMWNWQIP